jgi:hypothetical protein
MASVRAGALPALGQPFAGGYFAGRYFLRGEERALVVADRACEFAAQWWDRTGPRPNIRGAQDYMDGMVNTMAMAEAGCAVATKVLRLHIGGHGGWHIPARDELLVMQVNLLQLEAFQRDGSQRFSDPRSLGVYWSSTQRSAGSAWNLHMLPWCTPDTNWATKVKLVRPVRSIPIIHEPDAMDLPAEGVIVDRIQLPRHSSRQLEEILGRFINEDSGRFYGRTTDLVEALTGLA